MLVTILTITFTSLIAFSSVFGVPGLENSIDFLEAEGNQLKSIVGGWFGTLFWAVGAFSLFAAAAGIVDYASRLTADILKTTYLRALARCRRAGSTSRWSGASSASASSSCWSGSTSRSCCWSSRRASPGR